MNAAMRVSMTSCLALVAGWALAQAPPRPAAPPGAPAATTPTAAVQNTQAGGEMNRTRDAELAKWVWVANQNEIELARDAQQHASRESVKRFAKMLSDDHSAYAKELQKFTGATSGTNAAGSTAVNGNQVRVTAGYNAGTPAPGSPAPGAAAAVSPATPASGTAGSPAAGGGTSATSPAVPGRANETPAKSLPPTGARPGSIGVGGAATLPSAETRVAATPSSGGLDFLAIHEEICRDCANSALQALNDKSNANEFDQSFVGMQIANHMETLSTLKVLRQHASPELAQVFEKGEKTVQSHLDEAKRLMEEMKGGERSSSSSSGAARSNTAR